MQFYNDFDLKNIDNLVNAIFEKEFIRINEYSHAFETFQKTTDIDENIEIKNELTNFINENFFIKKETFNQFLNLINDIFTNAINKYNKLNNLAEKDIFFLYKGGNLFNLFFKKIILQFPNICNDLLISEYASFFKKSDCDFSIIINPNLHPDQFNQIYLDMTNLSYLLLNRIRNIFLLDRKKYFDIFKFNEDYIKYQLTYSLINKINNIINKMPKYYVLANSPIHTVVFDNIILTSDNSIILPKISSHKHDILILVSDYEKLNNKKTIELYGMYKINNTESTYYQKEHFLLDIELQNLLIQDDICDFFITYNNNIEYIANNKLFSFSLVRLKYNFLFYYGDNIKLNNKLNLGGELIDISIPHINSYEHFNFYNNLDKNIIQINYLNSFYNIYSLDYLIYDMYNLIIEKSFLPWTNPKYKKRLGRILFLYFFKTLILFSYSDSLNTIRYIKSNIDQYTFDDLTINNYDFSTNTIFNIYNLIDVVKYRRKNIINEVNARFNQPRYLVNFIANIKKNLDVFEHLLENILQYIESPQILINEYENFNNLLTNDFEL